MLLYLQHPTTGPNLGPNEHNSQPPHTISVRLVLILSSHLNLYLPSRLFLSCLPIKTSIHSKENETKKWRGNEKGWKKKDMQHTRVLSSTEHDAGWTSKAFWIKYLRREKSRLYRQQTKSWPQRHTPSQAESRRHFTNCCRASLPPVCFHHILRHGGWIAYWT